MSVWVMRNYSMLRRELRAFHNYVIVIRIQEQEGPLHPAGESKNPGRYCQCWNEL
jgi:hypothetical protein